VNGDPRLASVEKGKLLLAALATDALWAIDTLGEHK
jgi:hypothetical protein